MRTAKKSSSSSLSIPSPIGGWNSRDALGDMGPTDAVSMLNFWPRTSDVQLRKGYTKSSIINSAKTLLHFNGTNGSTVITDENTANTWAVAGNAQISTAQSKFGGASLLLDGTGDYVTGAAVALVASTGFNRSIWFRTGSTGLNQVVLNGTEDFKFRVMVGVSTNRMHLSLGNGTSWTITDVVSTGVVVSINTWYRVRAAWDGATYKLYLSNNGAAETEEISVTSAVAFTSTTGTRIGADPNGSGGFNGHIDEYRNVVGATVLGVETPPSAEYSVSSGQINTLMAYNGAATAKLFASGGSEIYNVTSGSVDTADVSSISNSKFEYVNVSTAGGNFMLAVNGADKLRGYNGTSWWIDGDGTHDITGLDTATCTNINLHKTRVWLIKANTLTAWYLPVNSIAGAATSFSFNAIARKGGYLVAMGTWTIDGGNGVDDMAVFITNKGEVIVYQGTDPSSASTWGLVGVYDLAPPVSRRCFMKYMGDLLILTQDGLVPLSSALNTSRSDPSKAITYKIQQAMTEATTIYGPNFGWCIKYYPKANMLIVNVPITEGNLQEQYVMNTITKAWARFDQWNANCFEIFNDELYFGSNGFVGRAWNGLSDNVSNINATAKQAFNYFGSRGLLKRWTMLRPVIMTNGSPGLNMSLNIDFEDSGTTAALTYTASSGSLWDTAVWDVDLWGGGLIVQKAWQGVNGIGYCAAPRLQAASQGIEVYWASSDIVFERGGIL